MKKQSFLNIHIDNISLQDAICVVEAMIIGGGKYYVIPVNVDVIVKAENDVYLKEIIDKADMILVDGKPLIWISKLYKESIKDKISGSDIVPILCELSAKKGYSIFILGGKDGIAEQAKNKLEKKYSDIKIVGTYAPPFGFEKDNNELLKINEMINKAKPDILIVCLGCPKQEKWVYENYQKYDAKISICAGATVDFLAGNIKRAPKWMREHGFEWFYRFLQEPKRLFKRYFIDDMKIMLLIIKYLRKNKL